MEVVDHKWEIGGPLDGKCWIIYWGGGDGYLLEKWWIIDGEVVDYGWGSVDNW